MEQRRLKERLHDERLESQPSAEVIAECEHNLKEIVSTLERDFGEFRKPNGKRWRESWSGSNVDVLAQRLAEATGSQSGQSDYYVFKLMSFFTHNAPGALFLRLSQDRETADWKDFRAALDEAGRQGLRKFLYEASMCFVDIVGIAGDSITGYERQWFDEFALPVLKQL